VRVGAGETATRRGNAGTDRPGQSRRTLIRTNCPAASSSAWRWPAPWRRKPHLLLLDEPFSNLDVELRERLSLEVRDILKRAGMAAILVTHDQNEAFVVADMVGIMREGRIEQWDTPYNLYHRPATRHVADFIGQGVFLPGEVLSRQVVEVELGRLDSEVPMDCASELRECQRGCRLDVLLRPDDVIHDDASEVKAEVVAKAFRGAEFLYTLRLPRARRCCRWCPRTTTTPSAKRSASARCRPRRHLPARRMIPWLPRSVNSRRTRR
jgi:ABC-type sugar transport system ATPase subunit